VTLRLKLGAPGVYQLPSEPLRELTGVRMDVCAFVGVSPRGPSREPYVGGPWRDDVPPVEPERPIRRSVPVAVESWTDYVRLFGAFEGPGMLPWAVSAFFENGGRRAYIVRIVHDYTATMPVQNLLGRARGKFVGVRRDDGGSVRLFARNEGVWGNSLEATLSYTTRPLVPVPGATTTALPVSSAEDIPVGTLLRLQLPGGTHVLRTVQDVVAAGGPPGVAPTQMLVLDQAATDIPAAAEVVEGVLEVNDGNGRTEQLGGLGLSSAHPRWAATVIAQESALLFPHRLWASGRLVPADATLPPAVTRPFLRGLDRYRDIEWDDFFDDDWLRGDDVPGEGITCLADLSDLGLLAAPDLYEPWLVQPVLPVADPVTFAGPEFAACVDPPPGPAAPAPPPALDKLRLDPSADLDSIVALQQKLVDFAEAEGLTALLDVPPGLRQKQILHWRSAIWSSRAAAYHPWLYAARVGEGETSPIEVNPSAVAAGIIARRELADGIPFGPANELGAGIVDVADAVSGPRHDELHQNAVNVFLRERDGVRLTAARTLSADPAYRQLSVRRLVTMIERTLERQLQWLVFEPNTPALRADVSIEIERFLRALYRGNAFAGATEAQAFFVRCDETLNPTQVVDAGRLVAEIGIAPAEPIEFIVLRLAHDGDGTLRVEGVGG
jgi:Bacteriophage tail sheath protein